MSTKTKVWILTIVVIIVAFLTSPNAPLGGFWNMPTDGTQLTFTQTQLSLFIFLGLANAIALGLGLSFLIFGKSLVSSIGSASKSLVRWAHIGLSWLLISWWFHANFHTIVRGDIDGILKIEFGFHLTLIITGVILVIFFIKALRK